MAHAEALTIERPSPILALTELPRAIAERVSLPWARPVLMQAPHGDGHPVLVLPGFMTTDFSTRHLRHYLDELGYDVHAWRLGRNLGPKAIGAEGERLEARLDEIHRATGKTVSLIGWSLGGIMARLVAQRMPSAVRQVITLGSPFTGDPSATNIRRTYERLSGQKLQDHSAVSMLKETSAPLPMPSTAIYTRGDGIVAWQNCLEPAGPHTDYIEVRGSHCGLGVNPSVLYAVADRLAQPEDAWQPFERTGLRLLVYPSSGHSTH